MLGDHGAGIGIEQYPCCASDLRWCRDDRRGGFLLRGGRGRGRRLRDRAQRREQQCEHKKARPSFHDLSGEFGRAAARSVTRSRPAPRAARPPGAGG
ncbi:MAG: hypothetical protein ACK55I_32320, partial [bacterium]